MDLYPKRLLWFALGVLFFFGLVFYRLVDLQLVQGEKYRRFGEVNSLRQIRIPAPRGRILDQKGRVLAENQASFALSVVPAQIKDWERAYRTLAHLLDWEVPKIQDALQAQMKKHLPYVPLVVDAQLDRDRVAKLRGKISQLRIQNSENFDLNGIDLVVQYHRVYPPGPQAGHVLGYVREARQSDLKDWEIKDPGRIGPGDLVGVAGIEKKFDGILRGFDGIRRTFVDALGREVDLREWGLEGGIRPNPVVPGRDLQLTLDQKLNEEAYEAFGERVGALVALDPRNGAIRAMVSLPSYDPEVLTGVIPHSVWNGFREHPQKILLNRPLQAAYPPGSTHKIVTALAGLGEGKIDFRKKIRCHGYYQYGGRKFHCWNRGGHGSVNLEQALIQSCDVFFYKLGEALGPDRIAKYAAFLGLGKKTEILDDWERSGLIPTRDWKQKHRQADWLGSDNLGNAIGQGFNLVTPLQNALMVARVANGGKKITPHLLQAVWDPQGGKKLNELSAPSPLVWNLSPQDMEKIRKALTAVVQSPGGTGKRARVSGVEVAGKTGTAQVVELERKGKGKGNTEDHAWFVAYAPAENPEIAIAVVVEHGGSGGSVAAPIAQRVLAKYFEDRGAGKSESKR